MRARLSIQTVGLALLAAVVAPVVVRAARREAPPAEVPPEDPVALAALLVRDGLWDRADAVLDGIEAAAEGVDVQRFYALRALVRLQSDDPAGAAEDFAAALAADPGAADPILHLYRASALVAADRPAEALAALQGVGEVVDALPGTWLLRARAAWLSGDADASWAALEVGAARFPDETDFPRQQVLLLVDLGLYQEAGARGADLLGRADAGATDAAAIAEALRRGGALDRAAILLESARLRFPDVVELWTLSAAVALQRDQPLTAATFLQAAAELDPALALESAECFRRAGQLDRALYMNGQVPDAAGKARQRLGLLLEAGRAEAALALEPRARRLGLLEDDNVAYGLAYARFQAGDFEGAEALLKAVEDPAVFAAATRLRQAMAACEEDPGACG